MRLSKKDREIIKQTCLEVFGTEEVYLFGSRVDDTERGGDIDLYILPDSKDSAQSLWEKKLKFLVLVKKRMGDQRIDVALAKDPDRPIEQEARKHGVRL